MDGCARREVRRRRRPTPIDPYSAKRSKVRGVSDVPPAGVKACPPNKCQKAVACCREKLPKSGCMLQMPPPNFQPSDQECRQAIDKELDLCFVCESSLNIEFNALHLCCC